MLCQLSLTNYLLVLQEQIFSEPQSVRRLGLASWTGNVTCISVCCLQEAQLSPRDLAMRRVSWNLANCHTTVQKLLVRQVLKKSKLWSWRVTVTVRGEPGRISRRSLASENYSLWAIVWCCLCNPAFSRFSRLRLMTDRHRRRQTQGHG